MTRLRLRLCLKFLLLTQAIINRGGFQFQRKYLEWNVLLFNVFGGADLCAAFRLEFYDGQ